MTSSKRTSRLRRSIHLSSVDSMPRFSGCSAEEKLAEIAGAGYDGVQLDATHSAEIVAMARACNLAISRSGRINQPSEAEPLAKRFADEGAECATVHVGWGLEDDGQALELVDAVVEASILADLPLYPETHRATILQDTFRTVRLVEQRSSLFLNADFSHWYTGLEMVYGDFDAKVAHLAPIFPRVRYVHGRIGDPGCMQVCIKPDDTRSFVGDFRHLWTAAFRGFLLSASPDECVWFTAELLGPEIFYARTLPGSEDAELCERWTQSLLLLEVAEQCFLQANAVSQDKE